MSHVVLLLPTGSQPHLAFVVEERKNINIYNNDVFRSYEVKEIESEKLQVR